MKLAYDTETTGLVKNNLPDDHPAQPHLVQLAGILSEDDGTERASFDFIIKPNGWTIPDEAAKVHGITTEIATRVGIPLILAVAVFTNYRAIADEIIGHNVSFDQKVMAAAIARCGKTPKHPGPNKVSCTKDMATPLLKLPPTAKMKAAGFNKFKPPTLSECYEFFFQEKLIGAHGAQTDARASLRVYWHIQRMFLSPGLV